MPCEQCLNRRKFIATAAGVAGLAVISACGDGVLSGVQTPVDGGGGGGGGGGNPLVITVANFAGLATVGELVKVSSTIAAKRTGTSTFDAFDMHCTHQRCLVNITNGDRFDCPCHFSAFSSDGNVIRGPAASPLEKLSTSYDQASDMLTIG